MDAIRDISNKARGIRSDKEAVVQSEKLRRRVGGLLCIADGERSLRLVSQECCMFDIKESTIKNTLDEPWAKAVVVERHQRGLD
jgi:hypothetical protein